ncbi:S1C family serine protease [Oceanobacillus sp. 1P07AA]|uniref:S1C family serine protease n=1 Tax=Oceanobacillus sp. 1P07AA TaxID=3132293 RepID=UPI0039A50158
MTYRDNNNDEERIFPEEENKESPSNIEQAQQDNGTENKEDSYYDNHSSPYNDNETASTLENDNNSNSSSKTNKNKQRGGWLRSFSGGAIGGIISSLIILMLLGNNILPSSDTSVESNQGNSEGGNETSNIVQTLASDDAEKSTNIDEVSKAVVGVINKQQQSVWEGSQEAGTGSGIIYKKEDGNAYVVTNQHVVDGAQEVEVVIDEEHRISAEVLGVDSLSDLAVLEIDGENVDTIANFGSSTDTQVGETVLAIGNPLGMEFVNTVTKGIISGLNRSVEVDTNSDGRADWITEVLQTDAAINPGNSGGALVNENGDVIGINSMKIAQSSVEGIGFAIPVDEALPIIEQLETEGEVSRPLIGISTAPLNQVPAQYRAEIEIPDDIEGGMVIADVQANSPADNAGLEQFDVITKVNDQEVTSIIELRKHLYENGEAGEHVKIEYVRDGEVHSITLKLDEFQAE